MLFIVSMFGIETKMSSKYQVIFSLKARKDCSFSFTLWSEFTFCGTILYRSKLDSLVPWNNINHIFWLVSIPNSVAVHRITIIYAGYGKAQISATETMLVILVQSSSAVVVGSGTTSFLGRHIPVVMSAVGGSVYGAGVWAGGACWRELETCEVKCTAAGDVRLTAALLGAGADAGIGIATESALGTFLTCKFLM